MALSGGRTHSTGIAGLDSVLKGVLAGDNIVWQVDSIEDYRALVRPYCEAASRAGRTLVSWRLRAPRAEPDSAARSPG